MAQRVDLEVTVISAQDLKNVKLWKGKMNPYAVAYISPNRKLSTAVATGGGVNPSWNFTLHLACEERLFQQGNANIRIDLLHRGIFSNKPIGTALIPLTSLMDSKGKSKLMAYQVKRPSGRQYGVLNVAVKVGRVRNTASAPAVPPKAYQANPMSEKSKDHIPASYPPVQVSGSQHPLQYQPSLYQPQYAPHNAGQYPAHVPPRYQPVYAPHPGYQAPYSQQPYYQQQAPRSRFGGSGGGSGGAGFGTGLLAGAVGSILLDSAVDSGFGDGRDGDGFGGDDGGDDGGDGDGFGGDDGNDLGGNGRDDGGDFGGDGGGDFGGGGGGCGGGD